MKIFFNYDIATGDFKGFYNDSIYKEIPNNSVEITEELWEDMLLGQYKFNIAYINEINSVIELKDKEVYFVEIKETEDNLIYDLNELSIKSIAELKVENQKKDYVIDSLAKKINELSIRINKIGG